MNLFRRQSKDITAVYDKYADMLYRLALTHLQNSHDAQDAVQDVFVKYMGSAAEFRDEEHEKAWFIRVTVNRCSDMLRRGKIRSYINLDDIAESMACETSQSSEDVLDLMRILAQIPEKFRAAIVLHYLEGFSAKETADILGISESAVKMRLLRGREALKERFDKESSNV